MKKISKHLEVIRLGNDCHRMLAGTIAVALLAGTAGVLIGRLSPSSEPAAKEEHAEGEHAEGEDDDGAQQGFIELDPAEVSAAGITLATVVRGGGSELVLPGRAAVVPGGQSTIQAPLTGVVTAVHIGPGVSVGRGQPIVTIRSGEGAALRASVASAAAETEAARAAFARETRLLEAGVIARQDWEAARAAHLKAQAASRAAQAQAAAVGSPGPNGVTTIRSPIAGTVTSLSTSAGSVVQPGAPVAEIANARNVELVFDAPAAVAGQVRAGTRLVASDASGEEIPAVVIAVAPAAGGTTAAVRARSTGYAPASGTPVTARILTSSNLNLVVPSDAIQTVDGRTVVFVAEAKGFRVHPVVAGRSAGGRTEILSGLADGERVAAKGAFLLKAELEKGEAEHGH